MKKILIVTAHPTDYNLTTGIADIFKEEKEKQGNTVEVLDLYKAEQLPFYTYDVTFKDELTDLQKHYQQMILDTDEIVIIYPFWWGTTPAILKNWIDSVFTMGFAAKYGKNGRPIGLLQGKSVRVISTSGAPTFLYCINGIRGANKKIWKKTIIEFCGMEFKGFHLYGGMDTRAKKVDKMFACVRKLAKKD